MNSTEQLCWYVNIDSGNGSVLSIFTQISVTIWRHLTVPYAQDLGLLSYDDSFRDFVWSIYAYIIVTPLKPES